MLPSKELEGKITIVIRALEGRKFEKTSPVFAKVVQWLRVFPGGEGVDVSLRRRLLECACASFDVTEAEILVAVAGEQLPAATQTEPSSPLVDRELELARQLPSSGWLRSYADYTAYNESPLSFHLFCSLCVLGASLGRRVLKPMGFFNIYPCYAAILIGPTGRVKKTTAVDVATSFIREAALCPIMADKLTPESLSTALATDGGHQFIYAPEFSVLFGRAKYLEGLTTLIIRLLDCPPSWRVRTQARQVEEIREPALTILGGSTMSLLTASSAAEVVSGGFLNRFVLVNEVDTNRCFPEPVKGNSLLEADLMRDLKRVKNMQGEMTFAEGEAKQWHDHWYHQRREQTRAIDDEVTAEIIERWHTHLVRSAMLLHLAHCDSYKICVDCLKLADRLLRYVEQSIPSVSSALSQVAAVQEVDFLLATLRRLGGAADHSTLLRKVSARMSTQRMKLHLQSLAEMGKVKIGKQGTAAFYLLREEKHE